MRKVVAYVAPVLAAALAGSGVWAQPPAASTGAGIEVVEGTPKKRPAKPDLKAEREVLAAAVAKGDTEAMRRLGEMHAKGQGGKKSKKKALDLWIAAEKAGDPLAPILVADLYYEEITGQKDPAPGMFKFLNEVPKERIDDTASWYEAARERDPRPEVKQRAAAALYVLKTLRAANPQGVSTK